MKALSLVILILITSISHAGDTDNVFAGDKDHRRIKQNAFRCYEDDIQLKSLWGDWFGSFHKGEIGLFQRKEMEPIFCRFTLMGLYQEGDPAIFDLLLKIKSLNTPEQFAQLLGLRTKFNDNDKERVRNYLKNYGVPTDSVTSQLAQVIVYRRIDQLTNNLDPRFLEKLNTVATKENAQQINIFQKTLDGRYIIEELLEIEKNEPDLNIGPTIESLLKAHINRSGRRSLDVRSAKVPVSTQLLASKYRNMLEADLEAYYFEKAQYNVKVILGIDNDDIALDYFNRFLASHRSSEFQEFDKNWMSGELCPLVVGKLATTKNEKLAKQLLDIYRQTNCTHLQGKVLTMLNVTPYDVEIKDYIQVKLLNAYPANYSHLTHQLLSLQRANPPFVADKIRSLINDGCKYTSSQKTLLKYIPFHTSELLADAAEAKCGELVRDLAEIMTTSQAWNFFAFNIKEKNIEKRYLAEIVKILSKNDQLSPDLNKEIELRAGREIFRIVKIARRVSDPKAQDVLLESESGDSEEVIKLKWKDLVIELQRSKMSDVQQKFVDALRLADSKEEIATAIREAMIEWQLKIKFVRTAADALRESIALFKPAEDQLASLGQAKIVLDQTLTKGGRPAIYNERFTSILDPIISGRAQCNGGTDFMLLHAGKSGLEDANEWQVVVFQPKHILPGVVRKNLKTKVETVESTVNKEGRGNIEAVNGKWPLDRKVILADDYLVAKILGSAMKDRAKNAEEFSARAEKVLGVKQGDITPAKPKEEGKSSGYSDDLNISSFGFGDANIPSGDIVRQDMSVVPQNLSGVEATRLAVPREEHGSRLSRFAPTKEQQGMTFKMHIPEYARVVVPNPQEDPLGHIAASIERELRYSATYHRDSGDPSGLRLRVEALLRKLTNEQLMLLADVVTRSSGAIVDVIINKQSNLKSQIESPAQKQIRDSRELVELHRSGLIYKDLLVHNFSGYDSRPYGWYRQNTESEVESMFLPPCSIESQQTYLARSRNPKACDYSADYSMIERERRAFQQNRKTKLHHNLIKFRVLLQDTGSDTPYALDLVTDEEDDGDFTVYFQPLGNPGQWRKSIEKIKPKLNDKIRGEESGHDQPGTQAPASPSPKNESNYNHI